MGQLWLVNVLGCIFPYFLGNYSSFLPVLIDPLPTFRFFQQLFIHLTHVTNLTENYVYTVVLTALNVGLCRLSLSIY